MGDPPISTFFSRLLGHLYILGFLAGFFSNQSGASAIVGSL